MQPIDRAKQLWPKAKSILLPYDGAATELFVTSLENGALPRSIEIIRDFVADPEIISIAYGDVESTLPLTPDSAERLSIDPDSLVQHAIRGSFVKTGDVCFYVWVDGPAQTHEVEMVFWNDLHFPEEASEEQHMATWNRIVDFAERLRDESVASKCILTPEHNGPTEELLDSKYAVVW